MRKRCRAGYAQVSLIVAALVVVNTITSAQRFFIPRANESATQSPSLLKHSFGFPGSFLLQKKEKAVAQFLLQHPEARLRKAAAWNFTVGAAYSWYADDLTKNSSDPNNDRYLVPSTCRAVGTHCYIFVEDSSWNSGKVNQTAVDSVRNAFDLRTPASPVKGIYDEDVQAFGDPPDVDSDPRIIILILDIKDGYTGTGGYVQGYFFSFNEIPSSQPGYRTSNDAEIYFLDCNPTSLTTAGGLGDAMSTTAHEFQHMIHWNYDPNEIAFVNEGCSLVAEVHCGYPIYPQSYFINETNHFLLDWRGNDFTAVTSDYSRAARFMTYLRDQLGMGVFRYIVASTQHGIAGLNAGFQSYGTARRFDDIFQTWTIANILNDTTVSPAYGYRYPKLPKAVGRTYVNPNVAATSDTIQPLAARYLAFKGGAQLKGTFSTSSAALLVKAVEIGVTSKRVLDVTPNVEFSEPDFGSTYSEIDFVVMNTDQNLPAQYSYQMQGTGSAVVELKWDETEPTGYYQLPAGDTVCVTFDGVHGAKLDSVRVALRHVGTMTGGVWTYSGVVRPSPLGKPLAVPISASIATETPVPYPVPFQNWTTVDLRSYHIDASQPFVVAFVCEGERATGERVMITDYASSDSYHSFTYLTAADNTAPGWYYLTTNNAGDTISIYLIRAYVSFGSSDTSVALPAAFTLSQNYPNPFNPGTKINYTVPDGYSGNIRIQMYDVLGRLVETVFDGTQTTGYHTAVWTPHGVASGVYYCVLRWGKDFVVRKLVYVH
ncbi:MAG: T9SS type A sorting domain-containing protein [Bacteroidota bacterium]|nr:T9SS type A sorting domain-containing protein [Bacteroidota bacterium]